MFQRLAAAAPGLRPADPVSESVSDTASGTGSLSHGRLPAAGAGFLQQPGPGVTVVRFARAFRPGLGSGPTRIKYAT